MNEARELSEAAAYLDAFNEEEAPASGPGDSLLARRLRGLRYDCARLQVVILQETALRKERETDLQREQALRRERETDLQREQALRTERETDLQNSRAQLERIQADLQRSQTELAKAHARLSEARAEAAEYARLLEKVHQSRSWRLAHSTRELLAALLGRRSR